MIVGRLSIFPAGGVLLVGNGPLIGLRLFQSGGFNVLNMHAAPCMRHAVDGVFIDVIRLAHSAAYWRQMKFRSPRRRPMMLVQPWRLTS